MSENDINICIVEDDNELNYLIKKNISKLNYQVFSFTNGKDFINFIDKNNNKNFLILIDNKLPDIYGKDIIEKYINNNNLFFIVMTGFGDEKSAVELMKLGVRDYLIKDITFIDKINSVIQNVLKDIDLENQLKEAEKKLLESEERYRLITENSKSFILELSLDAIIIFANSYFKEESGYDKNDLLDKNFYNFIYNDDKTKMKRCINDLIISNKILKCEIRFLLKNQNYKWIEYIGGLYKTKNNIERIILIGYDITERIKYEEDLKKEKEKAETANKIKSQFIANISHEIRTPMNGIMGMLNLLSKTELTDQQQNYIQMIKTSSDLLLKIINDILEISKIESGKYIINKTKFNIRSFSEDLYNKTKVLASSKNLEIYYSFDDKIPDFIENDEKIITQILLNLINNAIKFTEKGYIKIDFNLKKIENDLAIISISVIDSGIGIPEDKQTQIFDSFYQIDNSLTKKYQGTGLGLSIVKKLVEMLNGNILLQSKENQGSNFTVEIPFKITTKDLINVVTNEIIEDYENIIEKNKTLNKNINILIAEDNVINALFLKELLENKLFNIDFVSNGKKAIEKISLKKYDLIFMDIQMPEMDGIKATEIIREKEKETKTHIPIIALTAYSMKEDQERFERSGMDDYISKPIIEQQLYEKIVKYLYI